MLLPKSYNNGDCRIELKEWLKRREFIVHRGGMPGLASVTDAWVVALPSRLPSHSPAFTSPMPVRACVHASLTVHTYVQLNCAHIFSELVYIWFCCCHETDLRVYLYFYLYLCLCLLWKSTHAWHPCFRLMLAPRYASTEALVYLYLYLYLCCKVLPMPFLFPSYVVAQICCTYLIFVISFTLALIF